MTPTFWKDKKVLMTGHTGFKGSWLSLWLQRAGADLVGFALEPPTQPNLFTDAGVARGMVSLSGDVRDAAAVWAAIDEHRPEIVLHLAAQTVVRTSYDDPAGTYATNVMGTVNVMEAVRGSSSVRVVVNVTTDKVYENHEWSWGYRESDALGGYDPYSNSKACSELVTSAYRRSYFSAPDSRIAVATARAGNVVGGGDWTKDQLIPDIFRSLIAGRPVTLRHPNATRPWQFVLEPLDGYLTLAEHLWNGGRTFADAWNFGPVYSDIRTVEWIAKRISSRWPGGGTVRTDPGPHPHEATLLKLDVSKSEQLLGWKPRLPLTEAIDWITEWYGVYKAGGDVAALTRDQIVRYADREAS